MIKKYLPILFGIIFIISGTSKVFDIVGFQRIIAEYGFPDLHIIAPFIVISEILIGGAIVLNIYRRLFAIISIIFLIIFTIAYTYANNFYGITDCGCFGNIKILSEYSVAVYLRNIILIAMAFFLVKVKYENEQQISFDKKVILWSLLLPSIFISGMSYRPFAFSSKKHPLKGMDVKKTELYEFIDKSKKNQLLMFVSYNCPHCWNSMANYKEYISSGVVDTSFVYIVVDKDVVKQEDKDKFLNYFSNIITSEIDKKDSQFIEAFPSSFFIIGDTINKVLLGTLPSPYVFKEMIKQK